MRAIAVLVLSLSGVVSQSAGADHDGAITAAERWQTASVPPEGVALFDLHDPGMMSDWTHFVATTPMLNAQTLPQALQNRLTSIVALYRSLTPADHPAFFVATYFDVLSERLLAVSAQTASDTLPLQVCPVFASGPDAPVGKLLAVASGLPGELFINAPGDPERYRYLFLQTEYSHCRFLATLRSIDGARVAIETDELTGKKTAQLPFTVGARSYTATLGSREQFRALLETVGDVDAMRSLRGREGGRTAGDEADVLSFVRLLALLATDGRSGYAAIPILYPLIEASRGEGRIDGPESLPVADALQLAFQARALFREIVPFTLRNTGDLAAAKRNVMTALADDRSFARVDARVTDLLKRFVTESDLLLVPALAYERMPSVAD